jgi:hypothetical protein
VYPNISVCRIAMGYATPDFQCCSAFSPKCGCCFLCCRPLSFAMFWPTRASTLMRCVCGRRKVSRMELTIDAERCPTCNGAESISLRGARIACPTCCATRNFSAPVRGTSRTLQGRPSASGVVFVTLALGAIAAVAMLFKYGPQLQAILSSSVGLKF